MKQAFMRNADYNKPDAEILELLGISLNNNVFQFQGKFYKQIWGTAMGQKYAPHCPLILFVMIKLYLIHFLLWLVRAHAE